MKQRKLVYIFLIILVIIGVFVFLNFNQTKKLIQIIELYSNEHNIGVTKLYQIKQNKVYYNNKYIQNAKLIGISNGYIHSDNKNRIFVELFINGFCYTKKYDSNKINVFFGSCKDRIKFYEYTGSEQVFVAPYNGKYHIELWGAAGGKVASFVKPEMLKRKNGRGAYVSGDIHLNKGDILYVYVGGKGKTGKIEKDDNRFTAFGYPSSGGTGGYNGGGNGFEDPETQAGGGGGGATDVRLVGGKWDNFESLKSRIMVAGGGGGMSRFYEYKNSPSAGTGESGSGGTLKGIDGKVNFGMIEYPYGRGSTQTSGYKFGIGDNGTLCMTTLNGLGGGAGGYFGSYSGRCSEEAWQVPGGAGGGSSYVSGCQGCKAIDKLSTENNIKMLKKSEHYSKLVFTNIIMKSGDDEMPNPKNGKKMIGNDNNGYARISYIENW